MARASDGPWFFSKKQTWYATVQGRKVSLRVKGEDNAAEAKTAWHRLMAGLPMAEAMPCHQPMPTPSPVPDPVPEPMPLPAPSALSLQDMVRDYLADATGRVGAMTLKGYAGFLLPFVDAFKGTAPEALTVAQAERWSKGRGWSQSYRCGFIGTLTGFFKWAVDTGRLGRNPVQGIRKPAKQSRGRKAIISPEDHAKLLLHATDDFGMFLSLLWLTGCRPGEAAGLTAAEVDIPNKVVILTAHKTADQTGKDRVIIIPDEAVAILRGLISRRPTGLLFPGVGGQRMTPQSVTKRMSRLCQKAGVKATAYGHRHTFATDALAQGVPDAHVAALLGHQGTAMLHRHYSHLTGQVGVLRDSLNRVRG